jgi:hypothetical protein
VEPCILVACCAGCEIGVSPGWQPSNRLIGHGPDCGKNGPWHVVLLRLSVVLKVRAAVRHSLQGSAMSLVGVLSASAMWET